METFKTARVYNYKDLLRDMVLFICMVVCIYTMFLLWAPDRVSPFNWILASIYSLGYIYDKISRERLHQLTFDSVGKEIILIYKSMFSEIKQERVPFEQARLEVIKAKSKLKILEPMTLYLLKGKREVFTINKSKDRVSVEILRAIVQTSEKNGIRIIHK